jgi:hypothetical protein
MMPVEFAEISMFLGTGHPGGLIQLSRATYLVSS